MATQRTIFHVVPNATGSEWVVSRENDDGFREQYRTKDEALMAARQRARRQEPSRIKVHKPDGDVEYESTFGDDSSPHAGEASEDVFE